MKARRGDVAVIETTTRTYVIGQGATEHRSFSVYEVTSITRDGKVKAVRSSYGGEPQPIARLHGFVRCHLVSRDRIDAAAALQLQAGNHWPTATSHGHMPYPTLEAAREALLPLVSPEQATA